MIIANESFTRLALNFTNLIGQLQTNLTSPSINTLIRPISKAISLHTRQQTHQYNTTPTRAFSGLTNQQ